jgi:hypothetical protein
MYKSLWKELHAAVCSINFFSDNGIKLTALTGVKVANYIITDVSVYKILKCNEVAIRFMQEDGYSPKFIVKMPFGEFLERINRLVEFEDEGYALIELDQIDTSDIPGMDIELQKDFCIGQQIIMIGYQADQDNLSLKNGIISSFFKSKNDKNTIQFDAVIKHGNSGSPLINAETGKVIGVVGHRLATISKSYEDFKKIIDENLRLLKKSEGMMNILEIDPIQVLIANQNQMKQVSKDFYRSASMLFGYANELTTLGNYIEAINQSSDMVEVNRLND